VLVLVIVLVLSAAVLVLVLVAPYGESRTPSTSTNPDYDYEHEHDYEHGYEKREFRVSECRLLSARTWAEAQQIRVSAWPLGPPDFARFISPPCTRGYAAKRGSPPGYGRTAFQAKEKW